MFKHVFDEPLMLNASFSLRHTGPGLGVQGSILMNLSCKMQVSACVIRAQA